MRRGPAAFACVLAVCSVGLSSCASASRAVLRRPNIVFLLTDDLDASEIAVMPNLHRLLADQGITFRSAYVSDTECCPSRATTLTGEYAHNTGVETNTGSNGGFTVAHTRGIEASTIATWLHASGYRTAYIGKYLNGYPSGVSPTFVPPGWDDWVSAVAGDPYGEFNYSLNENGTVTAPHGSTVADYGTYVYTSKGIEFIQSSAAKRQPFFLYLNVYAPHQPATPAPQDATLFPAAKVPRTPNFNEADVATKPTWVRTRRLLTAARIAPIDALYRKRLQSLQAVDRSIGRLVSTLTATGQLADTYFVFASDNGFHLGQHRLFPGKGTAYETDVHVPLIVRGPSVPPGTVSDALVGNVDLAPTFAAIAGAPTGAVDGRSFLPLLHSQTAAWARKDFLLEHWKIAPSPPPAPGTPTEPRDSDQIIAKALDITPAFRGLRTNRYTYVEYVTGERELYDDRADPWQLHNLATTDPALISRLQSVLAALASCRGAQCRVADAG